MKQSQQSTRSRVRTPSRVFTQCPECESPNLLSFEGEVICSYCPWNSIELHVEARFSTRTPAAAEEIHSQREASVRSCQPCRMAASIYHGDYRPSGFEFGVA